jgi:hypothetical protein
VCGSNLMSPISGKSHHRRCFFASNFKTWSSILMFFWCEKSNYTEIRCFLYSVSVFISCVFSSLFENISSYFSNCFDVGKWIIGKSMSALVQPLLFYWIFWRLNCW